MGNGLLSVWSHYPEFNRKPSIFLNQTSTIDVELNPTVFIT